MKAERPNYVKYFVVARNYYDQSKYPVYEVKGEFTDFWLAMLFKNAYYKEHGRMAYICENIDE